MNNLIKKLTSTLGILLGAATVVVVPVVSVISCEKKVPVPRESADGYKYFLRDNRACIVGFPDIEEIVMPQFIDGYEVDSLGYHPGWGQMPIAADGKKIKKLTITHNFFTLLADFPILEVIEYIDPLSWMYASAGIVGVGDTFYSLGTGGSSTPMLRQINIRKGERENIPAWEWRKFYIQSKGVQVNAISFNVDTETFSYEGLIIGTDLDASYPGFGEKWNGNNPVMYSVTFDDFFERTKDKSN